MNDIQPAPVFGMTGVAPSYGLCPVEGASVQAGGFDYAPDLETIEVDKHCAEFTKDGARCRSWASGEDGLCAGHRKARRKAAG